MYELRDSSWFDRGTGHCKGVYDDTQDLALLIVEAEDMNEGKDEQGNEGEGGFLKEELLLSTRVEKDDIYARQQGQSCILKKHHRLPIGSGAGALVLILYVETLIVWTEPTTQLDIALSFQDSDGCEDIWSFISEVQRHLNNLPSMSLYLALSPTTQACTRVGVKLTRSSGDADPGASSPRLSASPPMGNAMSFRAGSGWQEPTLGNVR